MTNIPIPARAAAVVTAGDELQITQPLIHAMHKAVEAQRMTVVVTHVERLEDGRVRIEVGEPSEVQWPVDLDLPVAPGDY